MYNNSNLQRTVTAAIGAVLVSVAVVGAAVGPVTASALLPVATSGQVSQA